MTAYPFLGLVFREGGRLSEPFENPVTWFVEENISGAWVVRDFRAYQRLPSFNNPLAPGEYRSAFLGWMLMSRN